MANSVSVMKRKNKSKFTPNMENYRTSLKYEGLLLRKEDELKSITELKRKYAR